MELMYQGVLIDVEQEKENQWQYNMVNRKKE